MSSLWVPQQTAARKEAELAQSMQAEIKQMALRFAGVMRHWTECYRRDLGDDRLEIVFIPPTADAEAGVIPGRYHLIRYNEPPTPPTVEPIQGTSGEFVEPGQWHIEKMRHCDLQNPQLVKAKRQAKEAAERAKERERQRDDDERMEHLKDAYRARFLTSVSMNNSTPWSQNSAGRRGRKK